MRRRRDSIARWAAVAGLVALVALDVVAVAHISWWLPAGVLLGAVLGLSLGITALGAVNGGFE